MGMPTTLSLFRAAPLSWCRAGLWVLLLVAAATPAWAIQKDPVAPPRENLPLREDCSVAAPATGPSLYPVAPPPSARENRAEVVRAIDAFPEVVVFPIWVAGPVIAAAAKNIANKIAQASATGTIAVIYPDIGEPYRSIFMQIIEGIENRAKGRVANFVLGANVDAGELSNSLRRQDARVVIALGRQGMKAASALDGNISVVVGGVMTTQENEARNLRVNSLSPDPALLFSRLKGMMPRMRRVFTVYDPRQNAWMIRLAKEAARAQGMELVAHEAQDLRGAMRAYQEILAAADSKQDALWLPQDSTTVEDSAVLPMVLRESWERSLTVFSSNFGHVRRGVLFSLYPNNVELGRHLAGSALDFLASGENTISGMVPLREVLMAINLRTAKHLGADVTQPRGFDMAFPEQ